MDMNTIKYRKVDVDGFGVAYREAGPVGAPALLLLQYTTGVKDKSLISPDGYNLDNYYMARSGAHEAQLDLFLDYASNVAMYSKFQEYFRQHQPPLLAVWGNGDPFFLPAGAEAFKRDLKN